MAKTLAGMIFGQLGRVLLAGHPVGCTCATCAELDGHAEGLVGLLERSASDGQPVERPPTRTVTITDVRVVPSAPRPSRPRALPASTSRPVAAEVDGRPVAAELVRVDPAPPKARKARKRTPGRSSR